MPLLNLSSDRLIYILQISELTILGYGLRRSRALYTKIVNKSAWIRLGVWASIYSIAVFKLKVIIRPCNYYFFNLIGELLLFLNDGLSLYDVISIQNSLSSVLYVKSLRIEARRLCGSWCIEGISCFGVNSVFECISNRDYLWNKFLNLVAGSSRVVVVHLQIGQFLSIDTNDMLVLSEYWGVKVIEAIFLIADQSYLVHRSVVNTLF
jgi:hypothetical protein